MTTKQRYEHIIKWFIDNMPVAETELDFDDPFSLLVSVILSAQCTDKRVNMITPALINRFPTAEAMAEADTEEIFQYIKSCSYPNSKAHHLSGMSKMLVSDFGGKVPEKIEDLMKLPGVGRKTANVVTLVAFGNPAMPVDTHIFRVSERLGLTTHAKNPADTERQLLKYLPDNALPVAHHWLILHGRYICVARKPKCGECGLREWCRWYKIMCK
ncbi:MAG TPA: endonuclease III [Bacteroidales bacterium]|nr:endonuclease III [Bacteroidales bacterium]